MPLVVFLWATLAVRPQTAAAEEEPGPPAIWGEAQAWYVAPRGWIFITRGSQPGTATRIHEGHEFALDPGVAPVVEVEVRLGGPHALGLRGEGMDASGVEITPNDFVYHGATYPLGRHIDAEIGTLFLDLEYRYRWRATESLTVTPHAGVSYWGFSSRIRTADPLPAIDQSRRFSSGLWLLGGEVSQDLGSGFEVHLSLLGGFDGADRYSLEARGGVGFHLSGPFSIGIDVRYRELRFHTSTNQADLRYLGPSAGILLRF
jgi:hypothetical protein